MVRIALISITLAALLGASLGQSGSGGLRGSILDADFSVPVAGATVLVEGTGLGATTNEEGSFFVNDIPPGQYSILASKDGFIRERRPGIVIIPGSVKEIDLEMTAEVVELDEFVVSQEELIESTPTTEAITLRTELKQFADVIGQQFIAQTGAGDAAKLLAKTTGVNVSEGKFIVVRGLADRYNSVTLNGLRVPSSDPDRRAVALDLFPSSVIRDLRTSKTFLPDLPGESTGANINVVSKSVPDKDFAKVKIGTGYNTQATGNPNFLTYNGGGTGMLGTAADRSLPGFIRRLSVADLPPALSGVSPQLLALRQQINETLSTEMGTKERAAPLDFSLEASIGDQFEFMGAPAGITVAIDYGKRYGYSDRDALGRYAFTPDGPNAGQVQNVTRLVAPPDVLVDLVGSGSLGVGLPPSGILPYGMRLGQESMRAGMLISAGIQPSDDSEITFTYFFNRIAEDRAVLQLGLSENDDVFSYREAISYIERQIRTWQLTGTNFIDGIGADLKVDWGLSYNQSYQLEPDQRFGAHTYDVSTGTFTFPTQLLPYYQRVWREIYDESYTAKLDLETDIFEGGLADGQEAKIKFGGLLDYSDRNYRGDTFGYLVQGTNQVFNSVITPETRNPITLGDVLLNNLPNLTVDPSGAPFLYRLNEPEIFQASQMISAGYAMIDLDLSPSVNLVIGGRIETTDLKVRASPIWIYPEQNLRFELLSEAQRSDQTIRDLLETAAGTQDSPFRALARSNPALLARSRADIAQVDFLPAASFTWELSETQRIRAALSQTIARPSFKEISPVIFAIPETGDYFIGNVDLKLSSIINYDARWEWFPDPGALIAFSAFSKSITNPIEFSQAGQFVRYINVDSAIVYGFELEFQRSLSFLADELKSFSIGANYSYIKSAAERTGTGPFVFGQQRRLQGQPDYIVNFNLTYEDQENPWSGGVFLNITGPQLFAVSNIANQPDVFQEPFTTLDVGISYRLSKLAKLTLRASNLTDAALVRYFDNSQRPIYSSRRAGVNYSLSLTCDW